MDHQMLMWVWNPIKINSDESIDKFSLFRNNIFSKLYKTEQCLIEEKRTHSFGCLYVLQEPKQNWLSCNRHFNIRQCSSNRLRSAFSLWWISMALSLVDTVSEHCTYGRRLEISVFLCLQLTSLFLSIPSRRPQSLNTYSAITPLFCFPSSKGLFFPSPHITLKTYWFFSSGKFN